MKTVLFIIFGIASSAFAQQQVQSGRRPVSGPERFIERSLKNYVLLDSTGREGPAILPGTSKSPFAAVIEFASPQDGGREVDFSMTACTGTHTRVGEVVTNAACLTHVMNKEQAWVYLIYYDNSGTRQVYQVSTFDYLEPAFDQDKVSIVLPTEMAKNWSPLIDGNFERPDRVWEDPESPMEVVVWAYDQLSQRPDVVSKLRAQNTMGMVFNPRIKCLAHSVPTSIQMVSKAGDKVLAKFPLEYGGAGRKMLFLDSCNQPFLEGNTGAMVGSRVRPNEVLGIYQTSVTQGEFWSQSQAAREAAISIGGASPGSFQYHYKSYNGKTYQVFPYKKEESDQGLISLARPFVNVQSIFPEPEEVDEDNATTVEIIRFTEKKAAAAEAP